MQTWKKVILGIIAFLFMLTFPIALIWFSVSGSILNADTYKPMIPLVLESALKQNTSIQMDYNTIKPIEPVLFGWLDNIFNYINSNTDKLNLELPSDEILKPIAKQVLLPAIKQNMPNSNQLTSEQIDALFEQQYPTIKQQLQNQLTAIVTPLEQQLIQVKDAVKIGQLVGMIALILSLLFLVIAIAMIWQVRSIMNWIGTYLLLGSIPLLLTGIGLIFGLSKLLQSAQIPQEVVAPITTFAGVVFNNLVLYSAIFSIIGIVLLFVKFAFQKEQPTN